MMPRHDPLFVSHGAPDLAISAHPAGRFLEQLGSTLPPARAWIVVSAHLDRQNPTLVERHGGELLHDYRGFDPALAHCTHPAADAPEVHRAVFDALRAAGVAFDALPARPMDHGVWAPLRRLDPPARTPVVQLGVGSGDARAHFDLGRALRDVQDDGVGLIASGAITHGLQAIEDWSETDAPTPDWVTEFLATLTTALEAGAVEDLFDWQRAPGAARNHPTPEHLMPLFVALGAARRPTARRLHRSFSRRVLAMDVWAWGDERDESNESNEAAS